MRTMLRWLGALALGLLLAAPAAADLRHQPLKLRYVGPPKFSPPGVSTIHTLELVAYEPNVTVTGITVASNGWAVRLLDAPAQAVLSPGSPLPLQLETRPTDELQPVIVSFLANGQPFQRKFRLAATNVERSRRPHGVTALFGKAEPVRTAAPVLPSASPAPSRDAWREPERKSNDRADRVGALGGVRTIRVHGRFVYEREDGVTIGADGVTVRVYDEDDLSSDDLLVVGVTNSNGDYDLSFDWDASGLNENDPDIYVEYEAANSEVDVIDPDFDANYLWASGTTVDFTGTDLDRGTTTPADETLHPALHALTDVTRNWRWYLTEEGYDLPEVGVRWPENDTCTGAWYSSGTQELHICSDRSWREDTHGHEYGHHFVNIESDGFGSGYCNGICDFNGNCGHCIWCQETGNDAWNEGWPNWIAHVQTSSYAATYGIASVNTRDQESVDSCGVISGLDDPTLTEGFLGAFLQDVWDSSNEQDPLATTTWRDQLSWGTNEIFDVTDFDEPTTAVDFITALKNRYPSFKNQIWETAKNSTYEMDVLPPPFVTSLTSTSHSLFVSSPDPTITFTWTRADDDWSGPSGYSVRITETLGIPDTTQDIADVTTYTTRVLAPGTYWFTIRTRDRSGKWGATYAVAGPYVIRDPEPANLQPFQAAGWAYEMVPRAAADAGANNVPAPTTLPGDALSTYWNFHGRNDGETMTSANVTARLESDGLVKRTVAWAPIDSGQHFAVFNNGPLELTGGRHTWSTTVDHLDQIAETDENDNVYGRQWTWIPTSVGASSEVTRSAPPDRDGGWDQITEGAVFYNADGLRFFSSVNNGWHALAVHPLNPDDDYDCRLHFATAGADTGFGSNIGFSTRNAGQVDAVIVNRRTAGIADWDVGVLNMSEGTGDYTARHVVSTALAFGDSQDVVIPAGRMMLMREVSVPAAGPVSFSARIKSGRGPVTIAWFDPTFTTGDLGDADGVAITPDTATWARIDVNPMAAGFHALALYRDPKDGTDTVIVTIEAETTPADLRAYTPLGWFAPLVPRPANDGVIINVPAPDTLHGNVASTWLNFALENDSPTSAPTPTAQFLVDGAPLAGASFATLAGGDTRPVNGSTARTVRGGRHTLSVFYDAAGVIDEKYEDNNTWGDQWVWSPLPLAINTPIQRPAPPDPTGGWEHIESGSPWFNCDGLRTPTFAPSGQDGWWGGVAVMSGGASDVNTRLHEMQPGPTDGFKQNLGVSAWGTGQSDFHLINFRNTTPRAFDVGVIAGSGTENYVAEAVRSSFRGVNPDGVFGPFTIGPNRMLQLHEVWLDPGTYTVDVLNDAGTVDWGVTLHEPVTYLRKSGNIAASYLDGGAGVGEQFTISPLVAGYYCVAVWKVGAADLPLSGTYRLGISHGTVATDGGPVARTALSSVHPNPARGRSTMAFALAEEADAELEVFDVHGARVRTLVRGRMPAGRHSVEWRGDDDQGRPVAQGVYLVRFRAGGVSAQRKVVRVE